MAHQAEDLVIPAERRLWCAEPTEVVGGVLTVLRHPRHRQQVAVVGRVGSDEVPDDQGADHHVVAGVESPPLRGEDSTMLAAVRRIENGKRRQRQQGAHDADDEYEPFEDGRGRRIARVDGHVCAQPGEFRRRSGQVGEESGDLWALVGAVALRFAALGGPHQRGTAGVGLAGGCRHSDELGGHGVGVGVDDDVAASLRTHVGERGRHQRHVADDYFDALLGRRIGGVAGAADEQAALSRLRCLLGGRRQQDRIVGAEPFGCRTRNRDVEVDRDVRDEWCRDRSDLARFDAAGGGPVDLRRGLLDRHQRCGEREEYSEQAGDDRDEFRSSHGLRLHKQ